MCASGLVGLYVGNRIAPLIKADVPIDPLGIFAERQRVVCHVRLANSSRRCNRGDHSCNSNCGDIHDYVAKNARPRYIFCTKHLCYMTYSSVAHSRLPSGETELAGRFLHQKRAPGKARTIADMLSLLPLFKHASINDEHTYDRSWYPSAIFVRTYDEHSSLDITSQMPSHASTKIRLKRRYACAPQNLDCTPQPDLRGLHGWPACNKSLRMLSIRRDHH